MLFRRDYRRFGITPSTKFCYCAVETADKSASQQLAHKAFRCHFCRERQIVPGLGVVKFGDLLPKIILRFRYRAERNAILPGPRQHAHRPSTCLWHEFGKRVQHVSNWHDS